ncbi:hypothetical protein UG46_15270 [Pseudomonas fluorescens]|nr:hypothetical protein UG46_15270 [Pseudomonas fluorescens]
MAILRKPTSWLNILASTLIFGAMFSVYSYSAEYLSREAGMSGKVISAMLILVRRTSFCLNHDPV